MKKVMVDFSHLTPDKEAKLRKTLDAVAWESFDVAGHPHKRLYDWTREKEPIEEIFPELNGHLEYM